MNQKNLSEGRLYSLYRKTKSYLNIKENLIDSGLVLLASSIEDCFNLVIDHPIRNLANGSGTMAGIYELLNSIRDREGNNSNEMRARRIRGFYRSLIIATAATTLRIYLEEHESIMDYFISISSNVIRYSSGFILPLVFLDLDEGGSGGDDDSKVDDEPPKNPNKKDLPTPDIPSYYPNIPKPIRDRIRSRIPTPSKN